MLYVWLVILRVILTLVPERGYIHPDEFFQNVEITAGDQFNLETVRAWEFNTSLPVRNIVFPLVTSGLPYYVMNYTAPYLLEYISVDILTPYYLLVVPRMMMTLLSFISDWCVFRMCQMCNLKAWRTLKIYGISYILLTYATRTFSNSVELVLVSLLLYCVTKSMIDTDDFMYLESLIDYAHEKCVYIIHKVFFYKKKKKYVKPYNYTYCVPISVIITAGVFNRPTFFLFAFPPLFYWLQRGLGTEQVRFTQYHFRLLLLLPGTVITSLVFIMTDSIYYKSVTFDKWFHKELNFESFLLTPMNFIIYNINPNNLAMHGLHPRYLHFIVNVPLLFGVLGIVSLYYFVEIIISVFYKEKRSRIVTLPGLFTSSYFFPIIALSFFCHQEPRFLLPCLVPLVIRCSDVLQLDTPRSQTMLRLWYIGNLLLTVFYGFLHQGGVVPALISLKSLAETRPLLSSLHFVFVKTYMPPSFLMMLPCRNSRLLSKDGKVYQQTKSVFVHDLAGMDLTDAMDEVLKLYNRGQQIWKKTKLHSQIYLVLPNSRHEEFKSALPSKLNYTCLNNFWFHLSTENPPRFRWTDNSVTASYMNLISQLSLNLYNITGVT